MIVQLILMTGGAANMKRFLFLFAETLFMFGFHLLFLRTRLLLSFVKQTESIIREKGLSGKFIASRSCSHKEMGLSGGQRIA